MAIMIVGLGPGDGRYLTRQAWAVLEAAERVYLRTSRHPAVRDLPPGPIVESFDEIYETAGSFEEVYERIVRRVLQLGRKAQAGQATVVYAVPGHPFVGEKTVTDIISTAKREQLPVSVVPGLSFIEPVLSALELDGLEGLQLFDAVTLARYNHPPLGVDRPLLLGQVHSRLLASELKLVLMAAYPDEHGVVLVHEAGTESQSIERLPLFGVDRSERLAHLSCLYIPPLAKEGTLEALAETVAHLRGPEGCPWDREQTALSLRPGFLEEASEVLAALDAEDAEAVREELGDLLFHLVIQTQIAAENGEFTLTDVVSGIIEKLKVRHPHVWGDLTVADSFEVILNWENLKAQERIERGVVSPLLDGIPITLPALARSQKMQERAARVGFDWPSLVGVRAKVTEELAELDAAETESGLRQELGDVIFALVNWARRSGIDAETALREANRRFELRFALVEQLAAQRRLELTQLKLEELNELWEEAKLRMTSSQSPGA